MNDKYKALRDYAACNLKHGAPWARGVYGMSDKYKELRGTVTETILSGTGIAHIDPAAILALLAERDELLEALRKAASELSCMIDYVGESSAINMIGGRAEYNEANKVLNEICEVFAAATKGES